MTLSYLRVALVLPLAVGCAHAVYDGPQDGSDPGNSVTEQPVGSSAGAPSIGNNYSGSSGALGASAGSTGSLGGAAESESFGGKSSSAGATSGGAPGAGAPNSAGASSGGAPGAGAPNAGGAPGAGAASGGAPGAGAPGAGAPGAGAASGGAPSTTGCSGVPTWKAQTYSPGDQVQGGGKLYQCKPYPYTGWCGGTESFYAPGTGTNWTDAWDLVGPC